MKTFRSILCLLLVCAMVALVGGCKSAQTSMKADLSGESVRPSADTITGEQPVVNIQTKAETPAAEVDADVKTPEPKAPEPKPEAKAADTKTAEYTAVDISAAFNATAVGGDDGLDGYGSTYPVDALPTGSKTFEQGIVFNLPDYKAAEKNVVTAAGQTVSVTAGKYTTLYVLASATNGLQDEALQLAYGDAKAEVRLRISDWCSNASAGETEAGKFARAGKNEAIDCKLFIQKISLDATRDLTAITLPANKEIHIFAMTLAK